MGFFNWVGGFFDSGSDIDSSSSSSITNDIFSGPSVNIDGSPMVGSVDIHGHPFGVTDETFSSGIGSSCFDDSFSSNNMGCGSSMFDV